MPSPEKRALDPGPSDAEVIQSVWVRKLHQTHRPGVCGHVGEETVPDAWVFGRLPVGDANSANSEEVLLARVFSV